MDVDLKQRGLELLVIGGVTLWALSRRVGAPAVPPGSPSLPPRDGLPVRLSGGVGRVQVEQGKARMGAHRLLKERGEPVLAMVSYTLGTTRGGVPVPWRYRLTFRMGHSTLFGWKDTDQLGLGPGPGTRTLIVVDSGTFTLPVGFTTPDDPDDGQLYDIHVALSAAPVADPDGEPTFGLPGANHDGAFVIAPPVVPVVPVVQLAGSVGGVQVSQGAVRRLVGLRRP